MVVFLVAVSVVEDEEGAVGGFFFRPRREGVGASTAPFVAEAFGGFTLINGGYLALLWKKDGGLGFGSCGVEGL